jgi:hypothetical protein
MKGLDPDTGQTKEEFLREQIAKLQSVVDAAKAAEREYPDEGELPPVTFYEAFDALVIAIKEVESGN